MRKAFGVLLLSSAVFAAELTPQTGASGPVVASERRAVSLEEALKLAAAKNTDLAAAQAQQAQVAAQASKVFSAVLPELSLNGSLVHTTAPATLDFGGIIGLVGGVYQIAPKDKSLIPGPVNIVGPQSAYASLLISQILFTPQMILIPAASRSVKAAEFGSFEAREQVLLGVAKLYLGLEGLEQLEAAAKDAEVVALSREKDAKAQLSVGMSVEVALLRAQTETAQARSLLANLAGTREGLLAMMEALCGEPIRPLAGSPKPDFSAPQEEAASPWNLTYLVRANAKGVETLDAFQNYDRWAWLPTVLAQAKGNYNSNGGFSGQNFSLDLILAINFPLYDRGQRYVARRENDAKMLEAKAKLEGAKQKAKATWVGARANLTASEAALVQAESQAALAARAQKQLEAAFKAGVATSLELSDIDSKRFLAASAAAQARAQVEIRKVELAAAEGRLAKTIGLEAPAAQ